jgi:hypothetical protein
MAKLIYRSSPAQLGFSLPASIVQLAPGLQGSFKTQLSLGKTPAAAYQGPDGFEGTCDTMPPLSSSGPEDQMTAFTGRREFITLLGRAAVWPVAARAQQTAMPVVGVLFGGSPTTQRFSAIQKGLNAAGFVEGQNVAFEYRLATRGASSFDHLVGAAEQW